MGSCFPKAQINQLEIDSNDLEVKNPELEPVQLNETNENNFGANSVEKDGLMTSCTVEKDGLMTSCTFARKFNYEYTFVRKLGKGRFCSVKLYKNNVDGSENAIKIYSKKKLRKEPFNKRKIIWNNIKQECKIMKSLKHKNIVSLIDYMKNDSKDKIYLVMEYISGGNIMNIELGKTSEYFTEERAKKYFCDIVRGLEYIHSSKVIHRDIKPSNILLSNDNVAKITDFSESFQFVGEDDFINSSGGTPSFTPPELRKDEGTPPHGKPVDIWSLGLCLYCFVIGKFPYSIHQIQNFYTKYQNTPVRIPTHLSTDLQDLMRNMLKVDPSQRFTIQEIKNHPWISNYFNEQ